MKRILSNKYLSFYSIQLCILLVLPVKSFAYNLEADVSWDYSLAYQKECFDWEAQGHPVSQAEGNACIGGALKKSDDELNSLYQSLISVLEEKKMLKDSELAWIDFRNKECKLRNSGMGEGTATMFLLNSCLLDMTLKRIKDLKLLRDNLDCVGCPVRKR